MMKSYGQKFYYRKFKISGWRNGQNDAYNITPGKIEKYTTTYHLFEKRREYRRTFPSLDSAKDWIDELYQKAEGIDKFLSDITTTIQFIHIRNEPELVYKELTTKRELKESEIIEYLKDQGYEKKDIFELTVDTRSYTQPGIISANR